MAGRGGKRNTIDPSDVTVDQITKEIENLQGEKDRSYRNTTALLQENEKKKKQIYKEIVGGFIQGYEFSFEEGEKLSHGSLISECRSNTDITNHEATFLLLPKGERGRLAAERMFQSTDKMRGSGAIATAYLVAECKKLDKWIICYEKLSGLLGDNSESLEPFYVTQNEISPYWRAQLRAIIRTLSDMGIRDIYHGGMLDPTNYAVKSGSLDIKLIGLNKRKVDEGWYIGDLHEFVTFLEKTEYIKAATSRDWRGLSFLLRSFAMHDKRHWAELVLNHPLLLDPNLKIWSYTDLYEWTELIQCSDKVKFCNALYCLMPQYYKCSLWDIIQHCPDCLQIYLEDKYDEDGSGMIYMDIIKFVRNMIQHGRDVLKGIRTYEDLLKKIDGLFPGFMSLAYSVSKIKGKDMDILYEKMAGCLPYC